MGHLVLDGRPPVPLLILPMTHHYPPRLTVPRRKVAAAPAVEAQVDKGVGVPFLFRWPQRLEDPALFVMAGASPLQKVL